MIPVRIAGTATIDPGRAVPTAELIASLDPPPALNDVLTRTGIASRSFVDPDVSVAELGARALAAALRDADMSAADLSRIVFVSSTGGDVIFPATANRIAAQLGLAGTCDCFDLNNACLGFLTSFDMAARWLATGGGPVGVCVVEIGSRKITPRDPRPYLVFGDAIVAAVFDRGGVDEGVLASWLRNDGMGGGDVELASPALTGKPETIRFNGNNRHMTADAIAWIRRGVDAVLGATGLTLADVQWVLPHQPNGVLLARIVADLGIDTHRIVPIVHDTGSVGAASIPISLDRLRRSGRVCDGDRLLMVGVGAGISAGAMIVQVRR